MKKEMKKTLVIFSFLLCWSAVSSIPHHKTSNGKSVNELDYVIEHENNNANFGKESSDEASSGKDWGGNIIQNLLNFIHQKEPSNDNKDDKADNKLFLDALISQGKKLVEGATGTIAEIGNSIKTLLSGLTSENKLSDNNSQDLENENVFTWIQKNIKNLGKHFTLSDTKESLSEETEKYNRAKRDLEKSNSIPPLIKPHSVSEQVLKLSEGSRSNVLKSEKATVAEALSSRAAILKILARAKAKAAQAIQQKNIYDNDDFSKWLLSGSAFDMNIFRHHRYHRPSYNKNIKLAHRSKTETSNDNDEDKDLHTFAVSAKPLDRRYHEVQHTFNTLSDSTVDTADTGHSYLKLRHKSGHRRHLSPDLEITWATKRGHETNGMLDASQHQMHKSLSPEEAENIGLRYTSSHMRVPHSRFRVKDEEGIKIPKWKDTESMLDLANSLEFDSNEREDYRKRYIFRTLYDPIEFETNNESEYVKNKKWHKTSSEIDINDIDEVNTDNEEMSDSRRKAKLERKRYRYGFGKQKQSVYNEDTISFDNAKNQQHLVNSVELERSLLADSHQEGSMKDKNVGEVEHSAISTRTSAETTKSAEEKQSGNMLITKISTDTPTRKPVNIDIEHYHAGDRSAVANSATSFSSSLSDGKGSRHTNNVSMSPSVDDGLAAVETKTENDHALGKAHTVIDNDATSAEIEMGFNRIKGQPSTDSPSVHSSVSRAHSKTHLENQRAHHGEHQRSSADSVASFQAKTFTENWNKTRDPKEDQEVTETTTSSMEDTTSVKSEHERDFRISSSNDSHEENYVKTRKLRKYASPRRTVPRHRTSIEVIDIGDRTAEILLPKYIEFKRRRGSHNINGNHDSDNWEMLDDQEIEIDRSAEDLKNDEVDYSYDDTNENNKSAEMLEDSKVIFSDKRKSQQDEGKKSDKNIGQRNHRNKFNDRKNYNEHIQRNTHNQHNQLNQHAFNQHTRDMTSSSVAWNATRFATWEEYLYFIWEQKRKSNASNVSLESLTSAVKRNKERNNVTDGKISLSDRGRKKHMTDEDNNVYLENHEDLSDQITHSIGINETIMSTRKNEEEKIKDISDQSENHHNITHTESLNYDGFTTRGAGKIDNNRQDGSSIEWEFLNNSRVDVQAEAERVYGAREGNKNTHVIATQTAETTRSTDPKSNLQRISSETSASESDNTKKMLAGDQNETVFSVGASIGYQHHDDSCEISASSASKSQVEVKHHSSQTSKNSHEISAETLIETSSNAIKNSFRSNDQNASSRSSVKSRIEDVTDNKRQDMNAKISADAIVSIGVKSKPEPSVLENTSSTLSKSPAKSETEIKNRLMSIETSTANLEAPSTIVAKSSIASVTKPEQKWSSFKNEQTMNNINTKTSSATSTNIRNKELISFSEQSKRDRYLSNQTNNKAGATSKTSAKEIISNGIKDQHQSHLQKSISPSSAESSQILQGNLESEYNCDNSQESQTKIATVKNLDETLNTKASSSNIVKQDYQQASTVSSSITSVENENAKTSMLATISDDLVDQHNLLHTSSSLMTNINDLNPQKDNCASNIATLETLYNNYDNYDREDNKLHAKWLIDPRNKNVIKFADNKNIEEAKFVKQDTEDALSAAAKTTAFTDIKSRRNSATSLSSIDAAIKTWTRSEHDLDQPKEGMMLTDNTVTSEALNGNEEHYKNELLRVSEERNKHRIDRKKNYLDSMITMEMSLESMVSNDKKRTRDDLMEETVLSDSSNETQQRQNIFNTSKDRSGIATTKIAISDIISHTANEENSSSKDPSLIWDERIQATKLNDKNERPKSIAHSESTEYKINSVKQINLSADNINGVTSTLNDTKNENCNNSLKVTSNTLHGAMLQNKKLNNTLHVFSDSKKINNIITTSHKIEQNCENNLQKVTSSGNLRDEIRTKNRNTDNSKIVTVTDNNENSRTDNLQDMIFNEIEQKYMKTISENSTADIVDTFLSTETVNSGITDDNQDNSLTASIADVYKAQHESISSGELQNETQNAVNTGISVGISMGNIVSEGAREDESVQGASFSRRFLNIPQADNDHNHGNERTDVGNIARSKAGIPRSYVFEIEPQDDDVKETTLHSKQYDLNAQKEGKTITSDILLETESADLNKMHNVRQELLDTITSNSHGEIQHERNIGNIVKEKQEVTANVTTSAMSFGTVTSESQEKLITSSSESNLSANSQIRGNKDLNILQEKKEANSSAGVSANFAVSSNREIALRNKLVEKNYASAELGRNAHAEDEKRNVPKNNIENVATASEADCYVIKDEHQSGITTPTKHEYNSGLQSGMIRSSDAKDQAAESKNALNNVERSLKAGTDTTIFADASSSVGNVSKQDSLKMLSSSDSYSESEMYNTRLQNILQNKQKSTDMGSSGSIIRTLKGREITKIENDVNELKKNIHNNENTAVLEQATSTSNENNLLKLSSFANAQRMQQNEHGSNDFEERDLITADSMDPSDLKISRISHYSDNKKNENLKQLTETLSNNSHNKSKMQNKNHMHLAQGNSMNTLSSKSIDPIISDKLIKDARQEKDSFHSVSSDFSVETQIDENVDRKSSTDAKATYLRPFNLLVNTTANMQATDRRISQKDIINEDFSKRKFADLLFTARNLKTSEDNSENSTKITETESNLLHNQHNLHRAESSFSNTRDGQRNIKSTDSHATTQVAKTIDDSKNTSKDRKNIVNLSTLDETTQAYSRVKGTDSNDWLITSGAVTLAEERTQNKDKFNTLREAEQVAVHAETSTGATTATSASIRGEQRDICAEDPSRYQDSRDAAKNILDIIAVSSASGKAASKKTRNRNENKSSSDNGTTATSSSSSSDDTHAKTWTIDEERHGVSHDSEFLVNNEETRRSKASSASASISDNVHLGGRYNQINDETSTDTATSKTVKEEERLSVIETSLHPADSENMCDENVETKEFISAASSLYKMLDKRWSSEVLLMRRNPTGAVQVASLKNSDPLHVGYRLISQQVYEKIRTIIANKQTLCIDCPLSSL